MINLAYDLLGISWTIAPDINQTRSLSWIRPRPYYMCMGYLIGATVLMYKKTTFTWTGQFGWKVLLKNDVTSFESLLPAIRSDTAEGRAGKRCYLTHWGREKMATIFLTTYSNASSWMKMYEFWLRFHWSLFLSVKLTTFQHWFRQWLGASQTTSHCLNQWVLIYWRI